MAEKAVKYSPVEIAERAGALFGATVMKVSAPGGARRSSLRVHFADHTVIATNRPHSGRALHEDKILSQLGPICGAVPKILGRSGSLIFQTDVGRTRLSRAVQDAAPEAQKALAQQAIAAIFEIQAAASTTPLMADIPQLGATGPWIAAVVNGTDELAAMIDAPAPVFDRELAAERLTPKVTRFVKWDCRAGNAALDEAGALRWFDFEFAGLRHGAEDFAWIIGDEIWPVEAATMLDLIGAAYQPTADESREAYLDYLVHYAAFHTIQRIMLIIREARRRGWLSLAEVIRRDKVGVTPHLGIRMAQRGRWLAAQDADLRPLTALFDVAQTRFEDVLAQAAETAAVQQNQ